MLCQVLGQHWSAMWVCSTSPGSRAFSCPHLKLPDHLPPPMATSASADEAACTWQPHLRPGCCLHAVSSSDVVVVHCIGMDSPLTPWLHMAMSSDPPPWCIAGWTTGWQDWIQRQDRVCSHSINITPLQDDPVLAADPQRKQQLWLFKGIS